MFGATFTTGAELPREGSMSHTRGVAFSSRSNIGTDADGDAD